jgi:hypothetical protein
VEIERKSKWTRAAIAKAALVFFSQMGFGPVLAAGVLDVEIKPFALVDVGASFSARYLFDDQARGSGPTSDTFEERTTWEEEFILRTKSYVYHPGFLNIEFDFGPKFVQQDFDSSSGSNNNDETFLSYRARLNFLQLKSYNFSLYALSDSPSVSTGLAGRYLTERDEVGVNAQLYQSQHTRIFMDLAHVDTSGDGFGRTLDEVVDRAVIRSTTTYGEKNTFDFSHRQEDRESRSGSVGLPIQQSKIRHDITDLRARNYFGKDKRHWVNQIYRRFKQSLVQATETESLNQNYSATAHFSHSDQLTSLFDLTLVDSERDDADATTHRFRASVDKISSEQLTYGFTAQSEEVRQSGFESDRGGIGTRVSYRQIFDFGSVGIGLNAAQDRTNQVSTADFVQVFDEPVVLNNTVPVALAEDFVVAESVVVRNVSSTQQYLEGIDYRLVIVGSVTSIQRLLGSNIQDGETVLVNYDYQSSGTSEFDTLNASLSINASFLKYFYAGAEVQSRQTSIRSGELLTPTNDRDSLRFTAGAEFRVWDRWQLRVSMWHWDRDEEISPSISKSLTVQASTAFQNSLRLSLSGSFLKVDQELSDEDTNQGQFGMALSGRLWSRLLMGYDISYLQDDGGSLERKQLRHQLTAQWNYRAVRFSLRATHSDESLGATNRDDTRVTAEVARMFR